MRANAICCSMCVFFLGLASADEPKPETKNLIVNGSFEDGPKTIYGDGEGISQDYGYLPLNKGAVDVTGWIVTRGQVDLHANHIKAAKGRRSIDLNGSPGVGGIQQTVPTVKGKKYIVLFMLSGHPGRVEADETDKVVAVEVGGETKTFSFDTTGRDRADMGWVEKAIEFTASDEKTTVEFYSLSKLDRYCGPAIDDVRIYALD